MNKLPAIAIAVPTVALLGCIALLPGSDRPLLAIAAALGMAAVFVLELPEKRSE